MYFHAAKPMTLVFIVMCLYFTNQIYEQIQNQKDPTNLSYLKLFFVLCLSLFWDEMFYVYFLIVPFWFFNIFKTKRNFLRITAVFAGAFVFFGFITFYLYPLLAMKYFHYKYSFWDYAFKTNSYLLSLNNEHWLYNLRSLISVHIDPFTKDPTFHWLPNGEFNLWIIAIFCVLFVSPFFVKQVRTNYTKVVIGLFLFYIFECLILSRREGSLIYGAYYWGAPFSLFFVMWFAMFLTAIKKKYLFFVKIGLFVFFAICGIRNNYNAAVGHLKPNMQAEVVKKVKTRSNVSAITFNEIHEVWESRNDLEKAKTLIESLPANAYWLYNETYLQSRHGSVTFDKKGYFLE
jgi:hypothetical protein